MPSLRAASAFIWLMLATFSGLAPAADNTAAFSPAGAIGFREVPGRTPAPHSVDGPLLGNGDMKVALGGKPEAQRYFLGKNDLWRLQQGNGNSMPVGLGALVLEIPELAGASYLVRQPLDRPRTEAEFTKDGLVVCQQALVAADRNLRWIHLECEGKAVDLMLAYSSLFSSLEFAGDLAEALYRVDHAALTVMEKAHAAYALVNIAQRWHCTDDLNYARKLYPLVRDVEDFREDYLKFENDRYVIVGDAIHEGAGQDQNPILSLGLVRNAPDLALDMSGELGVDPGRHAKWQHLLTHLSDWSTQEMKGQKVFRYTEEGTAWWVNNTLGIQHIYPGNAIGLDSDPKWLAVARDTFTVMNRWLDQNGSNSFLPAAVRVGYDPDVILTQLRRYAANTYPNGFQRDNPHGIENFSTVPNTLNEMLCMSHVPVGDPARSESVIRVFPVWPKNRNARFHNIRCWGAFLISSELKNSAVTHVEITSERGRPCTIVNPWPDKHVTLTGNGRSEELSGGRLTFKTRPGEALVLLTE